MTLKINFNLNLPDSCCTLVPKNDVWTVPNIAAFQIAINAALQIPDYKLHEFESNQFKLTLLQAKSHELLPTLLKVVYYAPEL